MTDEMVEERLLGILAELEGQQALLAEHCPGGLQRKEFLCQVREYIEVAGEYGLAYEAIVAELEYGKFSLTGKAAVALLELGLMFRFKTERSSDKSFDSR